MDNKKGTIEETEETKILGFSKKKIVKGAIIVGGILLLAAAGGITYAVINGGKIGEAAVAAEHVIDISSTITTV